MRWPWQRGERRDSGGDFNDAVVRLIEAQAAGTAADASSTAAVEAASGALSRAFASAEVVGEPWVQECVSPTFLAQVGRDLIRSGDPMHVIRVGIEGMVKLIPASSWHWEGNHDPDSWTVRATCYGPSTSDLELASVGAGVELRASPMSGRGHCRGRTQQRGCNRRPNAPSPTKPKGRSPSSSPSPATAVIAQTPILSRC